MKGRPGRDDARRGQQSTASWCRASNGPLVSKPLLNPGTFVCKHNKPSPFVLCYTSFGAGIKRSGIEKNMKESYCRLMNDPCSARDRRSHHGIHSSKLVANWKGCGGKKLLSSKKKSTHSKTRTFQYPCSMRPLHQPGRLLFEHKHHFYFSEILNHIQH